MIEAHRPTGCVRLLLAVAALALYALDRWLS